MNTTILVPGAGGSVLQTKCPSLSLSLSLSLSPSTPLLAGAGGSVLQTKGGAVAWIDTSTDKYSVVSFKTQRSAERLMWGYNDKCTIHPFPGGEDLIVQPDNDGFDAISGLTRGGLISRFGFGGYFAKIIQHYEDMGYTPGKDLFAAAYDWRQGLTTQTVQNRFREVLETALSLNPGRQLSLVCHSMGGLLVETFLRAYPEWVGRIRRLVCIGTPWGGSALAHQCCAHGYNFTMRMIDGQALRQPMSQAGSVPYIAPGRPLPIPMSLLIALNGVIEGSVGVAVNAMGKRSNARAYQVYQQAVSDEEERARRVTTESRERERERGREREGECDSASPLSDREGEEGDREREGEGEMIVVNPSDLSEVSERERERERHLGVHWVQYVGELPGFMPETGICGNSSVDRLKRWNGTYTEGQTETPCFHQYASPPLLPSACVPPSPPQVSSTVTRSSTVVYAAEREREGESATVNVRADILKQTRLWLAEARPVPDINIKKRQRRRPLSTLSDTVDMYPWAVAGPHECVRPARLRDLHTRMTLPGTPEHWLFGHKEDMWTARDRALQPPLLIPQAGVEGERQEERDDPVTNAEPFRFYSISGTSMPTPFHTAENIMLDSEGVVKLSDFGWGVHVTMAANRRGTMCGTLDYLAPEMVKGTAYDSGVDVWSLGILLYELVEGQPPFMHDDMNRTRHAITHGRLTFSPRFTPELKDLLKK
ncbi:aurora kinase, partial [Kipferlia bialata]|eukprot:g5638.t1